MYSFGVFENAEENKKFHKSPSQAKVQPWCGWVKEQKRRGVHKQIPAQVLCQLGPPAPFSSLGEPDKWQDGRAASATPHLWWHSLLSPGTGHCTALQVHGMKQDLWFPHGANALPTGSLGLRALVFEGCHKRWGPVSAYITRQGSFTMQVFSLRFCWLNITCSDSHLNRSRTHLSI